MNEIAPIQKNSDVAEASQPPANHMVAQLIDAATRQDVDINKMERLFAMAEKMQASEAERAYQDAMSAAKAEIGPVLSGQKNTHTNSKYADLGDIAAAIDPIIARHGFSIDFDEVAGWNDPNTMRVVAEIMHSGGHRKTKGLTVALDKAGSAGKVNKTDIQAKGSTMTYARRYLKLMAFDIAVKDQDGNPPPARKAEPISEAQCQELRNLIRETGTDEEAFCAYAHIAALNDLAAKDFARAKADITAAGAKRKAKAEGAS